MSVVRAREKTAAQWELGNPVLRKFEIGLEIDTDKLKMGDGKTLWNDLGYFVEGPPGEQGEQGPPGEGGSQPGLALYGDGSDGSIVIGGDAVNWPDPTAIDEWEAETEYAVGDIVKNTGTYVRIFKCIAPGTSGTTGLVDYSTNDIGDLAPGLSRRGNRFVDPDVSELGPVWEQVSAIVENQLEGPLFCEDLTLSAGRTLGVHGWPIYARGTMTIEATAILSAAGVAAVDGTGVVQWGKVNAEPPYNVVTLLSRGGDGADAANSGDAFGNLWGGGVGGNGGEGADGPGGARSLITGNDRGGFTLLRHFVELLFLPFTIDVDAYVFGSAGGGGNGDAGAGKSGGGSGSCGSLAVVLASTLVHLGLIDCKGGDGADGEAGGDTGGGGGSSGGCCVLVYDAKTGAGTISITGGSGGSGQGAGTDGQDGTSGEIVEISNAA